MEPLVETISLDPEESNELAFKIKVEGASPAPARVRLVCEAEDVSYMFNGHGTGEDGVVQFIVPQMKGRLTDGMYQARVEVLIENRYFAPVHFQINFKKALTVVAESFNLTPRAKKSEITVTAAPVVVNRRQVQPSQVSVPTVSTPIILAATPHAGSKTPGIHDHMPTARDAAEVTLKERYEIRTREEPAPIVNKPKPRDEESLIRDLARSFIRGRRR